MDLKIELQLLVKKCIGDEENYMINRMVAAICLQNKKDKQLILSGVVKSLPTKEEINLAANECSDINEIICEDEYWVIAKNDGFQEGADFVINKLK